MVFSSATFLFIFLPAVYLLNLLIKSLRVRNAVLMLASLLFYGWGEPLYVFLMIASAFVNYLIALRLDRALSPASRKGLIILTVVFNIGALIFFKYAGFLVETINGLTGLMIPVPAVSLPIGISFFTFQAMSYVLDVYFGTTKAHKSFANILLYISFFPQLIAGPIVKYHDIAQQIDERQMTPAATARGVRRFCIGLAKKVLIANTLGSVADRVYAMGAGELNIVISWIGVLAYVMQIYFDFSGYSDMAIGLAHMFGFDLKENFNYPYISKSIQEFWRRWHISLSTWFREYVYIPLGGNRKGPLRTGLNKVAVFFLTGIWHGASWTFVAWGLFHGFFIMMESYGVIPVKKLPKALARIYTLLAVAVGFALFRADTFEQGLSVIGNMFAGFSFTPAAAAAAGALLSPLAVTAFAVSVIACTPVVPFLRERLKAGGRAFSAIGYACAAVLFILSVLMLSLSAYNPFIYFRF